MRLKSMIPALFGCGERFEPFDLQAKIVAENGKKCNSIKAINNSMCPLCTLGLGLSGAEECDPEGVLAPDFILFCDPVRNCSHDLLP